MTKYFLFSLTPNITCNKQLFIANNNLNHNDTRNVFELQRVNHTDKVLAIKYLGVCFDPNLNFKYHISQIFKKLSYVLHLLRSARNLFSEKYLKTLYFSIFHCHPIYALEIWSSTNPSFLQPLLNKQKAAVRIIATKYTMTTLNQFSRHYEYYP
jgi:hypothetical protein